MRMVNCSGVINVRATALAIAKSCIIQKGHHFAHFTKTKAHINQCKSVQIYTTTILTVHICTVTVTLPFIILVFISLSSLYL